MVWPLTKKRNRDTAYYERELAKRPFPVPIGTEADALQSRMLEVDGRIATIDADMAHAPPDGYRHAELATERQQLQAMRTVAEHKLRASTTPDPKRLDAERRRQTAIDRMEAEQRGNIERQVARLEAQGDFRQARLWRMELIGLRERIAAQVN